MTLAARKPQRSGLGPGDTVAERYLVRRVLGEGGMGQVLEVEHAALGRAFALKVLRREKWSDELVRRFNREARALARITTPRVAQVTDFGIDAQVGPFYVMELLEGETLEQRIERLGRVPPGEALAMGAELCDALAEVHAAGIIHRDLKPSNVGLPARGPVGVKLLDFGLAASIDEALLSKITQSQQILGSLPYMAPEQFNAAEPTVAIDVYALGVVLHEALTGQLPFFAPSTAALIHQILAAPVPALPPELPGRHLLEPLLERLLAKEPHQRFASAAAAGQALREVLTVLGGRAAHPRTRALDASHTDEELGLLPTMAMPESAPAIEPAIVESGTRLAASAPGAATTPYAPATSSHTRARPPRWPLHLVAAAVVGVVLAAAAGVGAVAMLGARRAAHSGETPVAAPTKAVAPSSPPAIEPTPQSAEAFVAPVPEPPEPAPAPPEPAAQADPAPAAAPAVAEPAVRPAPSRPRREPRPAPPPRLEPRPAPPPPFVAPSPPAPTPAPAPPRSSVRYRVPDF